MNTLLSNIGKLHTTPLGQGRICRNLELNASDVVPICRDMILAHDAEISRHGKNWYVLSGGAMIVINASTYTIITAHRVG